MIFKTTELWLAAALELHGYKVVDIQIERRQGKFAVEVDDLDITAFQRDYWNDAITGGFVSIREKVKDLSSRVIKLSDVGHGG